MRNIAHKVTGDDLTADEFNDIPSEEKNIITSTGQTLSAGDLYQIAKAVSTYVAVGDFYIDSGSGNSYILTAVSPLQAPIAYMDGFRIRFRISHTNTGASTVNVNGLGTKAIVKEDGVSPLIAGDLPIGEHGELIFHADKDSFELYSHKHQDDVFRTGMILAYPEFVSLPGWIPYTENNTIGSTASSAQTHDDATKQLFLLYWANSHVIISGGKGATALADWNANKTLTFPSTNGKVLANAAYWAGSGDITGQSTHILTLGELATHQHTYNQVFAPVAPGVASGGNFAITTTVVETGFTGSSTAFNVMQPTSFIFFIIKL